MAETVLLHQAWRWDCPECSFENFARSMVLDMDAEAKAKMLVEEYGVPQEYANEPGEWLSAPEYVKCSQCGRSFPAKADCEPDDDTPNPE